MRNAKKFFALLLALVMVLSICAPAFAVNNDNADPGQITIANAEISQDYTIYKAFSVDFDTEATLEGGNKGTSAVYYTNNQALLTLIRNANVTLEQYNSYTIVDENGDGIPDEPLCPFVIGDKYETDDPNAPEAYYITHINPAKEEPGRGWLNKHLGEWKDDPAVYTETKTAEGETVVFSDIPYGYYLITTTGGSVVTVNSTTPQVTVNDKNKKAPSNPTKTEDKVTVAAGDTVTFTSTVDATNYYTTDNSHVNPIITYRLNDEWTDGLVFDKIQSVKVSYKEYVEKTDEKGNVFYTDGTNEYVKIGDEYVLASTVGEETPTTYEGEVNKLTVVKVWKDTEKTLTAEEYELSYTSGEHSFTLDIPWAETDVDDSGDIDVTTLKEFYYSSPAKIEVIYTMKVSDGIFKEKTPEFKATNTAKYTYDYVPLTGGTPTEGGGNTPKTTSLYSFGFSLRKVDINDNKLTGAEFLLYRELPETVTIKEVVYPLYKIKGAPEGNKYYLKGDNYYLSTDVDAETAYTVEEGEIVATALTYNEYYQLNTQAEYYHPTDKVNYPAYKLGDNFLYLKEGKYYYQSNNNEYKGSADDLLPVIGIYYPTNTNLALDPDGTSYVATWTTNRDQATKLLADNSYDTMEVVGLNVGDYFLEEYKAPYGYDKPSYPFPVTLSASQTDATTGEGNQYTFTVTKGQNTEAAGLDDTSTNSYKTVKITNGTAKEMPTTGGAGTVALIGGGALLVVVGCVVLVTKKRMYNIG